MYEHENVNELDDNDDNGLFDHYNLVDGFDRHLVVVCLVVNMGRLDILVSKNGNFDYADFRSIHS